MNGGLFIFISVRLKFSQLWLISMKCRGHKTQSSVSYQTLFLIGFLKADLVQDVRTEPDIVQHKSSATCHLYSLYDTPAIQCLYSDQAQI